MGGRYRPGGGGGGAGASGARNNAGPFEGVRVNLFDIFRFSPGNRENLGVPKARWRNILVKLDVSLEELLSGVVKEVDVSRDSCDEVGGLPRTCIVSVLSQTPPVVVHVEFMSEHGDR